MIDAETFDRLLAPVACSISIYLPVDTEQRDKRAPQARLRTLVDGAQALLERCEIEPHEQASLIDSLSGAVDSIDFARHRDPGLAIFAGHLTDGNSLLEVVSLPQSPAELATVGTDFHIKPLLPLIAANQRFGILALSKANVRLLTATPFTWQELPLNVLPMEAQAELDSRPAAGVAPGGVAAEDARKEILVASPRYIATAVKAAIKNDPAPVMLVADPVVAGSFLQQVEIKQI